MCPLLAKVAHQETLQDFSFAKKHLLNLTFGSIVVHYKTSIRRRDFLLTSSRR